MQQITFFDLQQKEDGISKYVRPITYDETKPFLLGIHYARRMPCITNSFGLFVDEELVGVVTYGVPASHNLCIGLAGVENQYNVLELNRLVLLPDCNGGGQKLRFIPCFQESEIVAKWNIRCQLR